MIDKAFVTIKKFCEGHNFSKLHERILFHKFYEDFDTITKDYKDNETTDPSEDTIKGFISTLLSEMTLQSNVKLADDEIKSFTRKEIKKLKRVQTFKEFCSSALASIVGSIIFSIILIILFTIAQNQLKSWVNDLYNDNTEIQSTINGQNNTNPD